MDRLIEGKETKLFDPANGFGPLKNLYVATDATVARRHARWWMYLAGKPTDVAQTELFSASLPEGSELAATGWQLTAERDDSARIEVLTRSGISDRWDLKGGRHCPSYVKGWDPVRGEVVERIYYAGGAENVWGPYTIGYLEWNGARWIDQPDPVFAATEDWEHGSVYEPNLIYHEGKWKMWYVAGSNQEDYIVQAYSESTDGRSNWTRPQIVFEPEEKVFDFSVIQTGSGYEAVFSRVWLANSASPPSTGLWWCHSDSPSPNLLDWSRPVQIMTAEDRGWHAGPWKPSFNYSDADPARMFVFFDGVYKVDRPGPFPYVFTLGCLELERPATSFPSR